MTPKVAGSQKQFQRSRRAPTGAAEWTHATAKCRLYQPHFEFRPAQKEVYFLRRINRLGPVNSVGTILSVTYYGVVVLGLGFGAFWIGLALPSRSSRKRARRGHDFLKFRLR